jgi:hypothetical protein
VHIQTEQNVNKPGYACHWSRVFDRQCDPEQGIPEKKVNFNTVNI